MDKNASLEDFIAAIPVEKLIQDISTEGAMPVHQVRKMLATYINEMRVAMNLVAPLLNSGQRILEVGAGLCLFSLYLKQAGYNITALEPAIGGFDIFALTKQQVIKHYQTLGLPVIEKTAQELTPELYGKFNLIFSCNVMEHIPDYGAALQSLSNCLCDDGVMVHGCANYLIPYEPHFQIPVLKTWPNLSKLLFNKAIAEREDLWHSLNFIDYFDVRRTAKSCGLSVHFRRELMYKIFVRLDEDQEFRHRQSGIIVTIAHKIIKFLGLHWLLKYLPPCLSTPMIFELRPLLRINPRNAKL